MATESYIMGWACSAHA